MQEVYSERDVKQHVRNIERAAVAARKTGARADAIRAFCVSCVGGNLADVKECCCPPCPLYRFRMGRRAV